MTPEKQRIAIADACGLTNPRNDKNLGWVADDCKYGPCSKMVPDYLNDLNAMRTAEKSIGLHEQDNKKLRVKWINKLRDVVGRNFPKNKAGAAIVSDVDLLNSTAAQRAEAFLKALGLWKEET